LISALVSIMICAMRIVAVAVSTLTLVLTGCSDTPPRANKAAIEKSLREVEFDMAKNVAAKDAAAFSSHYATDAIFMTPGEPAAKGRDAIRTAMTGMFADPNLKLDFSADRVEIADSGDLGATHGAYTMTVTNPATKKPVTDKGSYVTVYRKQADGAWLASLDINTSEVPPAPPPGAANAPKAAAKKKGKKR
jgi:uncharacterized protein (TIGR02246 family)